MSGSETGPAAKKVTTTYDGVQHYTALRELHANVVAMDCPYTGKGEEFSPGELVQAAIGGCMLLSMGAVAMRRELDIAGARIHVATVMTDSSPARIGSIDITVTMPRASPMKIGSGWKGRQTPAPSNTALIGISLYRFATTTRSRASRQHRSDGRLGEWKRTS